MTKTAQQQREQAAAAYSVFLELCPARQLLGTLANKWSCLILCALQDSVKRHSELRRIIAGVSQKMLTTTLRNLERDGIVERHVTPEVPARVDYTLTPLGLSLLPVVASMKDWAEQNMAEVARNRLKHDSSVGVASQRDKHLANS